MIDDATLIFLGVIAASVLAIAAIFAISALDSLCALIREKRPDQWATRRGYFGWRLSPNDPPAWRYRWISWLVLGFISLDVPDDNYRALLWTARRRMMVCGLLFISILAGVIWSSNQA